MNDQLADKALSPPVQVVVFALDKETYAVPIKEVKEVIETTQITLVPGGRDFILGVINLHGKIAPVLDLEKLFNLHRDTDEKPAHLVITQDVSGALFGIQVDKVIEVLKVPENTIQPPPKMVTSRISADYVKGVIINSPASGEDAEDVILLLNLEKIVTDKIVDQTVTGVLKT